MEFARVARGLVVATAALLAGGLTACSEPPTELNVEVTSSLRVPDDVDHLDFAMTGVASGRMADGSYDIHSTWPHTLTLHAATDHSEMVTITVTGRKAGAVATRASVSAMFVPGHAQTVHVVLPATCTDPDCGVVDAGRDAGHDGGVDAPPCVMTGPEICDGVDNDCNGVVDDGFDLQTDSHNCGRCGTVCGPLAHGNNACHLGMCTLTCDPGRADCDGIPSDGCEADLSQAATCGSCMTMCSGATPACQADATMTYSCVSGCHAPTPTLCSGSCVDTTMSPDNCGACGMACPVPTNALATCTTTSGSTVCGFTCRMGFADCDTVAGNGCETDLGASVSSCGGCGNDCTLPHATPTCTGGMCAIMACDPGFADCNRVAMDGCETPLDTLTDCTACGAACMRAHATPDCSSGACDFSGCNAGFGDCDGVTTNGCETPLTTLVNCNACGTSCSRASATPTCVTGTCAILSCNAGFGDCDANDATGCETSLQTTTDCGSCSTACVRANAMTSCAGGTCRTTACVPGYGDCDGDPTNGCETSLNTLTDCGMCAVPCSVAMGTPSCTTGTCVSSGCIAGYADCDMMLANGCETALNQLANCGTCRTTCMPANGFGDCSSYNCQVASCNAGFGDCDLVASDGCETPLTTLANCATCGTACSRTNATASCATGACTLGACNAGFGNCDATASNGCETALNTLANCAGCGTACARANATASCATGSCALVSCNAGFGNCDLAAGNGCEAPLTSATNCGSCGTACNLANAMSSCATGSCVLGTCNAGFGNCDANAANGCEAPLTTNANCGGCGVACARANAAASCATGACVLGACNAGFGNCDGNAANGCETALTSLASCGGCGVACSRANATATCGSGSCSILACNAGFGNCDGNDANGCETALTTASNCGSCGVGCSRANAMSSCATGSCVLGTCNAGFGNCDATAANGCETPLTTATDCATCGTACSRANAMSSCATGACTLGACNSLWGNCDGNALNGCETPLNTLTNCMTCGTICDIAGSGETCASGTCVATTCSPGFGDCDGNTANGCEQALNTLTNCGACTTTCTRANATPTCSTGSCAISSCNANFGNCDATDANGCETSLTTLTSCAACGTACSRANATATCGTGACAISSCSAGFGNCDAMDPNGCETSLTTLTNCATCGTACSRTNATATCGGGSCAISSCNANFANCDLVDSNGCEVSLTTLANCASCGTACSRANATATCATGSCAIASCNGGFGNCDGNALNGCETSLTTLTNCSTCGTACSRANATATCGSGTCAISVCNAGFGNCDGNDANGCETALTSLTNCASCGTACSRTNATATCSTGSCAISSCSANFGNCDSIDSNGCELALTSLTNCGACGTACSRTNAIATCGTGTCAISTCNAGFGSCDGNDANGCEQQLNTLTNCASCGTACSRANATATCGTGACAISSCNAGFGNCDAVDSNGCEALLTNYYRDADADGYGIGVAMPACTPPVGYVANNTDCDDTMAAVNPGHAEVCANGIDDNCNAMVDEGCGSGTCPGSTAVGPPGGRFSVTLVPNAYTGTCGGAGSEAYLAFTISTLSDVFITTLGTTLDTVVYVRSASCTGTEVGCNDNADGSALASSLHLTGLAANTYNVFIDTKVAMSASVSVDIYVTDATMAGDRCGNPTFIPAGTASITGNTCGFASDYSAANGQGDCGFVGDGADADHVYYFYLPAARAVTFSGCQPVTVYDTTAYVRGVCTTPGLGNQLGCDEDGCAGAATCTAGDRSSLTTAVLPAGLYYFFADGYFQAPSWPCSCGAYQYNLTGI